MTNYKTQAETSAEMRSCPRFVQDWKVNDEKQAPRCQKIENSDQTVDRRTTYPGEF